MRIPSGAADPSGIASISGPMTVTFPSITSDGGRTRRSSNAGDLPPPNSTCISSLRMLFPSNAGEQAMGIGMAVTLTLIPFRSIPVRTASAGWTRGHSSDS